MLKKVMMIVGGLLTVIVVAFFIRLVMMAQKSPSIVNTKLGLENGHLKVCGSKPNCVSSQAQKDSKFYIEPLTSSNIEGLWDDLNITMKDMGFEIRNVQDNYLHFIAVTKIFGFVDDLEFFLNREDGIIEMRSESRVGYSDMGANRKRLEKIRKSLQPKG